MTWEKGIDINQVKEIRCGSRIFLGVGAIDKMNDIAKELKERGRDSVLVVTGKSAYEKTGAWKVVSEALTKNGVKFAHYNGAQPNPETWQVDEAVALAKKAGAKAVIGIGGGSALDAAKSAAILLEYPGKTCQMLFEMEFNATKAVPMIAVNLTHGTGSEANRVAVLTIPEKNYKPAIAYDCIYPWYSIDDPALMTGLPEDQTIFVSVDAVNHVIEAATTAINNPLTVTMGRETVELVSKYLPRVRKNPGDLEARYYLTYAALLGGSSFDNGLLHLTHALEHPLSGLKPEVTHGLGLAVLLPAVIKAIYPESADVLAYILSPIMPGLQGVPREADAAAAGVKAWLVSVGVKENLADLGFKKSDIPQLVELAFTTPGSTGLLALAPIDSSREAVERIYSDSF